jgi:hypothetical protein
MGHAVRQIRHWAAAFMVLALGHGVTAQVDDTATARHQRDVAALCRASHRLAGTDELRAAADYVAAALRTAGVERVILQPFVVPHCESTCTLTVNGQAVPLYPMQANLWQASISGTEPIRGRTLLAGNGEPESYGSSAVTGRVVVLSYETARRWEDAFAMGARAVIFVETGKEPGRFPRHETICADLPRFFMSAPDAAACGLLAGEKDIVIEAGAAWQARLSYNVIGWIPGTNAVFDLKAEEMLMLSAQLDTFGEVPTLSPGARGAANCATLLEVARRFAANPPARSVMVAFLGGEGHCLAGSAALYTAIYRHKPFLTYTRTHADFIAEYRSEKAFLDEMAGALNAADIFAVQTEAGRRALDLLRRQAETESSITRSRLGTLRLEQMRAKDFSPSATNHLAVIQQEETKWNDLRRVLAKGILTPGIDEHLGRIRRSCLDFLALRNGELENLIRIRETSRDIGALTADKAIVLHLGLDLGDHGKRWGIGHYDNEAVLMQAGYNNVGFYPGVFAALRTTATALRQDTARLSLIEARTLEVQVGSSLYFPASVLNASQMASRFGVFGLRLATCHDPSPLSGHPHDRGGNTDLPRLAALGEDAIPFVMELARTPTLSLRQRIRPVATYEEPEWTGKRTIGQNVMVRSIGSAIAIEPGRGALLGLSNHMHVPGHDLAVRYIVGQDGYLPTGPFGPKPLQSYPLQQWCCFLVDTNGRICFANQKIADLRRIELFPCQPGTTVALAPPDLPIAETTVLNALNDGPLQERESFIMEREVCATFFVPPNVEAVKTINPFGLVLLNADDDHPSGRGFPVGSTWRLPDTERQGAQDLQTLNEYRLDMLRERHLTNDSLEWLHGLAKAALRRAAESTRTARHYAELATARLLERRVYSPLRASMDDLVRAVVILLLLTIPFAHALERLLIGSPHIYRQIGWYCAFFLATFGILYVVHPAFAIATEPVVIFLAFVIIILSAIVIVILLNRFQSEIKSLQGLPVTVHSADVSRFGTIMAAVSMGISTMRRRPLRTLLTTVTVILLTFSILSFASFDSQQGILRRYIGSSEGVRGIFLHHALWLRLPNQLVDVVRNVVGDEAQVAVRRWVAPSRVDEAYSFAILAAREDATNVVVLTGLVGLDPADLRAQPTLQACFPDNGNPEALQPGRIFLPPALVEALQVRPGDRLLVRGKPLTFAGTLDDASLTRFQQLDQSPLFPIDYSDPSLSQQKDAIEGTRAPTSDKANVQSQSAFLPYYSANQVAIVHTETAAAMNGRPVAISVYPRSATSDIRQLAERLARLASVPVYATLPDGVYRLYFTTVLAVAGAGTLLIPIILGGLIVFGTMLGSVTDREKEIYSFSALGLAPTHIGMLFFAEASVYAVVGGMGGYILAQAIAFVTSWLSRFTSINVPEMNYSSTNAIVAILVVMATVLLSTIYPAYRGARSANPGVVRSWRLPRAQGDVWEFMFPFTVSEYDITGVMSFLLEHFNNYSDCSLGLFLAEDSRVFASGRSLSLASRVATAQFDLGVTQSFMLTSIPSEIEGIDEIKVVITRQSGTENDWRRTNRPFISDLRKQFLIWRSLPPETTEIYRRRTLELLAGQSPTDRPEGSR